MGLPEIDSSRRHPVTVAVDTLGGEDRVWYAWLAILGLALVIPDQYAWIVVLGWGVSVFPIIHRNGKEAKKEDDLSDLQAQYADGEISLEEFEREVELVLDDRAREIREAVERVGGVGPATSANIALSFRRDGQRLEDVSTASVDRLEKVNGVGPERAKAIRHRMGGVA